MATVPYDIDSILVAESGRIGPDIYRKTLNTSPWLKLIKQGAWPDEMGDALTVLTYERSLPANTLTWDSVTTNGSIGGGDGASGSGTCLPPVQTVNFAQTARQYSLSQTALESPPLCVNDLRFPFRRQEQLRMMFDILAENTSYAWQDRYRNEYFRNCGHKVVATGNSTTGVYLPENTTTNVDPNTTSTVLALFPESGGASVVPSSFLTQGILDRLYMKLIRDGAGNNPLDRANGRPQFGLICSPETSDRLIRSNADQRDDFRYSTRVSELLSPLGVERAYRGFFHMVDDFAPRYTVDGGVLKRVLPYTSTAATYGNKFDINPAYEEAEYEVSFVFHMDVIEALIPKPITSPGGNTKFDPVSYRGDFKWKNIPHPTENPDGTIGFFRGVLSSGTKPIRPEWGYAVLHLRCPNDLGLLDCEGASGVLS